MNKHSLDARRGRSNRPPSREESISNLGEEGATDVWLRCTSVELHHPMGRYSGEKLEIFYA